MNKQTTEDTTNVIEVSFNTNREQLLDEQCFIDDPLEDLLNEFCDDEVSISDSAMHSNTKSVVLENLKLSYQDGPIQMGDVLIKNTETLKENLKRLSYYLDEMYI